MSSTQTVKDYQNIDEKQKVVYNRLISKGYTPQAAIGILGNLVWESKLKTTQEGDIGYEGGSSFGIAQWRGDRLKLLKSTYGNGWTNLENQVDFLDWELNNTHKIAGKKLRGVTDVHLAGQAFSDDFEVPQKKYNQNAGRRNSVSTIAKKFIGYEPKDYAPQQTTEQDYTPYDTNFAITKIDEGVTPQQQAKQELKDINNEKQLIEDLVNSTFEIPQEKKEQQNYQQQPQIQEPTLTESYAQIANFIDTPMAQQGGFVVTRSNDRKGKTHKVTASDGTVKYFGDSNLGQHPKDPERKAAFYARHKENLKNNPFFRAFARKTWQEGGEINYEDTFQQGGLQNYFNVIEDQQGQRKFPNHVTKINGDTMATDGYGNIPLYVVPNVGKPRIIFPNTGEHIFKGATNFTEYPIKK